jgi:protein-disulfide isomerase
MVICIIAMVVFGILGIFSTKYRNYAKESFKCFFKMVQLKPCDTGFDQRIKSKITSKLMRVPPAARFFYQHFNAISWIFVITFFLSIAGIFYGLYNYWIFGNCNGPNSNGGACIYNTIANGVNGGKTLTGKDIVVGSHPVRGSTSASVSVTIKEFACLQCPYSKAAEPVVRQVLDDYAGKVNLAFFFFPLPTHLHGQLAATSAYCAEQQGKFWEYHDMLFERQIEFGNNMTYSQSLGTMSSIANNLGLNMTKFTTCINSQEAIQKVQADIELGNKLGLTATPTFFIGDQELVGVQTLQTFKSFIDAKIQQ